MSIIKTRKLKNTDIGQWNYSQEIYPDSSYSVNFDGDLVPGTYRLRITTLGGYCDERTFLVSPIVSGVPFIDSSTFRTGYTNSGNFFWKWDPPFELNLSLRSRISAYMEIIDSTDKDNYFWVNMPTYFGSLIVPKGTLDNIKTKIGDFEIGNIGIFLRINDEYGNNFQRNLSNFFSAENFMAAPPVGDANNDGKIGLFEAINALNVITRENPSQ